MEITKIREADHWSLQLVTSPNPNETLMVVLRFNTEAAADAARSALALGELEGATTC